MTQIYVGKLTNIGSDNGLLPGRRQAINWTNARKFLIGPLGIKFSEILIEINTFSFKEMHLKMSSAKWCLFPLGLNELNCVVQHQAKGIHNADSIAVILEMLHSFGWSILPENEYIILSYQNIYGKNITTKQYDCQAYSLQLKCPIEMESFFTESIDVIKIYNFMVIKYRNLWETRVYRA